MMNLLIASALLILTAQALPRHGNVLLESQKKYGINEAILRPIPKVAGIDGVPLHPVSRIVNGTQAFRGQFPFQAAVIADGGVSGGSLISQRWVLTAAHCVDGYTTIVVHLGAQNLYAADEEGRLIIQATKKIVHAQWDLWTLNNDIALVDLGQDVTPSSYILPIPLATGNNLFEGAAARVSGWGKTSDVSSASAELNYVDLTVISNDLCAQTYGSVIRASSICALGVGTSSSCTGDSGGPLVDVRSGAQIGVVSFGGVSCERGDPPAFARVTYYIEWISNNTGLSF